MPGYMSFDYCISSGVCIEFNRRCGDPGRRLSVILAALEMMHITADCSDVEKELIISGMKKKKNTIRRESDPYE